MRIYLHRRHGSALLITLVVASVVGFTLASYLTLVSSQNKTTMRSLSWNNAMPVIEAGIEEALTHVNKRLMNDMVTDGWALAASGYTKSRTLGDGYYQVLITATNPPIILSTGYVRVPLGTNYLARAVRVTTKYDALFAKGMVAKGQIDLLGNNIMTDSFDSSDPNYSTAGRYDPAKAKDNGDVATNSAMIDSLNVWNADLYGHVATGPGGTVKIGPNGAVGSKAWIDGGNHGIQPGWATDDMNVSFPDVSPPFSGGAMTPGSGNTGGTNYTYLLGSGNYQMSSLSMSGNSKMGVAGDAVLYVTGNVSVTGNAFIYIKPGASLKLYVSGSTASLAGGGVINANANALSFQYLGLPSNTSLSFSGNAQFTGTIYAPNADFTLGGGGNNTYDFVGASISKTVKMNGHFNFHYDEALGKNGPSRGFIVTSWNEI
jgi:hypothetical protein